MESIFGGAWIIEELERVPRGEEQFLNYELKSTFLAVKRTYAKECLNKFAST